MSNRFAKNIAPQLKQVQVFPRSIVDKLFVGAGLYYTVHNGNYHHMPLPFIFPSIYIGFFVTKNLFLGTMNDSAAIIYGKLTSRDLFDKSEKKVCIT